MMIRGLRFSRRAFVSSLAGVVALMVLLGPGSVLAGAQDFKPPPGQAVAVEGTPLIVEDGSLDTIGPYQLVGLGEHSGNGFHLIPNTNFSMQFGASVVIATFPNSPKIGGKPLAAHILFSDGVEVSITSLAFDFPSSGQTVQAGRDRVIDELPNGNFFVAPINEPSTDPSSFFVNSLYFGPDMKVRPRSWLDMVSQTDVRVYSVDAAGRPVQTPIFQVSEPFIPSAGLIVRAVKASGRVETELKSWHSWVSSFPANTSCKPMSCFRSATTTSRQRPSRSRYSSPKQRPWAASRRTARRSLVCEGTSCPRPRHSRCFGSDPVSRLL
jgi:hypothetical protein